MSKNKNKNFTKDFMENNIENKKNDSLDAFKKQNQGTILSDERVKEIKERYEQKEIELNNIRKKLDEEQELLNLEKKELEKEKESFEKDRDATIQDLKEEADKRLINEINAEMQRIRREEKSLRKKIDDELNIENDKRCQEILDKAQKKASEIVAEVEDKSKKIREEYTRINVIKQEILNDATSQAEEILKEAKAKALEIRSSAQIEVESIRKEYLSTQVECQEIRAKAERDFKLVIQEKMEVYNKKVQELHKQEEDLKIKLEELDLDKEDLELERDSIQVLKQSLEDRKNKYSPAAVEKLTEQLSVINQELDEYKKENQFLADRIRVLGRYSGEFGSDSKEKILNDLDFYRNENIQLHDKLAEYPTLKELEELRSKANRYEDKVEEYKEEFARRLAAEEQLEQNHIGIMELEQQKKISKTLKLLNEQLKAEIDHNNEIYNQTNSAKFPALCAIDRSMQNMDAYLGFPSKKSLAELVDYIRSYGAAIGDGHTKLYYSSAMIRSFIASMAASHLIILQGLSGTGKSSLPRLMKKALNFDNSLIPVQSSWNDNRELLGYDNDFTKKFKETEFTKAVYKASLKQNNEKISLIILDEMNLARIEYYFADFLAVMEKSPDDWYVSLVNNNPESDPPLGLMNGTNLRVSENIWFIGTANRDESTMGITDKVYDRALVLDFSERSKPFEAKCNETVRMTTSEFSSLIDAAINNKSYRLNEDDLYYIEQIDELMKDELDITFGNRIKMQMEKFVPVYCACGGKKEEAIDYMLRHKVLRKLDDRFEPYIISGLKKLKGRINDLYGDGIFEESIKYIDKVVKRLGDES